MKKLFALISLLFFVNFCHADLTIQIVQGVNKPYPVAVIPFGHDIINTPDLHNGIAGVIHDDLTHSGRFSDLPQSQMPAKPTDVIDFNWQQWNTANTGIEYAILGNVTAGSKIGLYSVTFSLLSLQSSTPLLNQKFTDVPRAQLRLLAHQISDSIYQTVTGKPGYFRTRIAYVEVFHQLSPSPMWELIVSDYDGYHPHALLRQTNNPIASPTWSPNGKKIAYVSYIHNRQAIFVIDLATGARSIIANFPGMNSAPRWSPDGTSMAMALSGTDLTDQTDLFVMNLNTHVLTRYTDYSNNTSPSWSPDGKTIVFNSDRGGSPQIYALDLGSKQITRLSYTGINNYAPIFTPDGKNLIIMSQQTPAGPINIAGLNLASNAITIITTGQLDKAPSVAPNGDMVIYVNYDTPHGILAEASLDGTVQIKLPATDGSVRSPAWSPFLN
jgi:TolB protein